MVKFCWLDPLREVTLEINGHVLQRGMGQREEPGEVGLERKGCYVPVSYVGCGTLERR